MKNSGSNRFDIYKKNVRSQIFWDKGMAIIMESNLPFTSPGIGISEVL